MDKLKIIARKLNKRYLVLRNWRLVAAEFDLNPGTADMIAHGYEPKTAELRCRLGLPALAPAAVCPKHGVVHVGRCPRERKPFTTWLSPDEAEERIKFVTNGRNHYEKDRTEN